MVILNICQVYELQKHNYIVTYKEEKHGICLSYYAAGYLETVSYDYTNGHWVYNSTDIFNMAEIPEGTIDKVLGLNSSGNFVKGVLYNFLGDIPVTIQTNYPYHITINVSDKPTKNGIYRLYTLENNIKQYYGIVEYTFDESNSYYVGMFKGKVFSGSNALSASFNIDSNYNVDHLYAHTWIADVGTIDGINNFKVSVKYFCNVSTALDNVNSVNGYASKTGYCLPTVTSAGSSSSNMYIFFPKFRPDQGLFAVDIYKLGTSTPVAVSKVLNTGTDSVEKIV